jgi:hypothetical protein
MKIIRTWLTAVALASISPMLAHAETIEDGRIWLNLTMQGDLPAGKWRWYAELQPRLREEGRDLDAVIVRPAVYYKLSDASSIWAGYGYIPSYPDSGGMRYENRLWQQFLHTFAPWNGVQLSSRTRLEERRMEDADDTGYRLRQMVRATHPISSYPKLAAVVWDEVFYNLNDTDWGAREAFDQNRAFVGLSYAVSETSKVEAGYLNQYVNGAASDRMNHVLSATFSVNFQ